MLLTDAFGGFGGISRSNRDFLGALNECSSVERVYALPRLIPNPIDEPIPEAVVYSRKGTVTKLSYVREVLYRCVNRQHADLVICGHLNLLPMAWLLAKAQRARLAQLIFGIECWTRPNFMMATPFIRSLDSVVSISRHTAQQFASWSGYRSDRAYILPCCVDLDKFVQAPRDPSLVARYGLAGSRVLMTMGRLAPEEQYKGFDETIMALPRLLKRFPNLKYLVVGGGRDRTRLETKARDFGVSDCVIFTGQIPENEKVAHYNLADVYVMPSSGEGFGIVLLEAAACGVPVIASRADGTREALLDGQLGRLIDPRSADELVDAITKTLETPVRGRSPLIENFAIEQYRKKVACWVEEQQRAIASGQFGSVLPRRRHVDAQI
jgi:glycosyltransferase involved in cell wall biosynthesis